MSAFYLNNLPDSNGEGRTPECAVACGGERAVWYRRAVENLSSFEAIKVCTERHPKVSSSERRTGKLFECRNLSYMHTTPTPRGRGMPQENE